MKNARYILLILLLLLLCLTACSSQTEKSKHTETVSSETSQEETDMAENDLIMAEEIADLPTVLPGETAVQVSKYVDENGDIAIIPKDFTVSEQKSEHTINTGVVVIGPDESEFVWVPTTQTQLAVRDFGSYFYGGNISDYWDETSANNIYDLAGNNWEWTQERYGSGNYVMRGGGYNLMGGSCSGSDYPAALRDPLPGNDHHPNVTFRVALFVK